MKGVLVHAVLALLGLSLSYQTWTRKEEPEQVGNTGVTIVECEPEELAALEISSHSHTVTVAPKSGADGTEYWITTQKKAKPKSDDSGDKPGDKSDDKPGDKSDDKAESKPDDKGESKPDDKPAAPKQARPYDPDAPVNFLASTGFATFLKGFAPLVALRDLGQLPKGKEAQFGLDKINTTMRMECGGQKVVLEVGGNTFGSGDTYVRDQKTKNAYLLHGQLLLDLQSAQFKFVHSELHDFTIADVDEAIVEARGQSKRLIQRNRGVKNEARWVDALTPDTRNELFGTWFQRVERLKVKAFLGAGKQPGSDLAVEATGMQPVLTIAYKVDGKPKGKVELVRVDTALGNFYYARSEGTRRWTSLYDSTAKQVEDDVAMVVGAEEMPAPKTRPSVLQAPSKSVIAPDALPAGHPTVPHHP